jgi:hypothetical protein
MLALNNRGSQFLSGAPPSEEAPVELLCKDKTAPTPFYTHDSGLMRNGGTSRRTRQSLPASLTGGLLNNAENSAP